MPTDKPPSPRSLILTPEASAAESQDLDGQGDGQAGATVDFKSEPVTPEGKARFLAAQLEFIAGLCTYPDDTISALAKASVEGLWQRVFVSSKSRRYLEFVDLVFQAADLLSGEAEPDWEQGCSWVRLCYAIHFHREAMALDEGQVQTAIAAALGHPKAKGVSRWKAIATALATAGVDIGAGVIEREHRKSRAARTARKSAKGNGKP